jgi:transcriptional regulator with XRE-family HTH domain
MAEKTKKRGPQKGVRFDQLKRTPFGQRLFRITRAKKITLRELARRIDISPRMVTYYETNEMGPPLAILKRMAKALNVTVSYLVAESPLKSVELDDTPPALRKDIETLKHLPRRDQLTVSNMIAGLKAKHEQEQRKK